MAVDDIKISTPSISDVYKALEIVATSTVDGEMSIIVTNYGESDLKNLGVWLSIAAHQGDVDNPADYSPHIDYQDLMTWGTMAHRFSADGGLWVYAPGAVSGTRIRRGVGVTRKTKIMLGDLTAGSNFTFKVKMQVPDWEVARRMFVNLSVE
tara:strand:+ start:1448 stop:1903 length:456 start_codon:yes stop_codon:yes gene_type:complete